MIITARTMPAVMKLAPLAGPPRKLRNTGTLPIVFAMSRVEAALVGVVSTASAQKP